MMRTPVYLLVILAQVNQAALLAGLATFMAKFIERQFSQTVSLSTMMIGKRSLASSTFEFGSRKWSRVQLHLLFRYVCRRSLYPSGGTGHHPGRSGDAKIEPVCQRRQQVVHRRRLGLPVLLVAAVAPWLLHPEGGWSLPSWVTTQSVIRHQAHI